MWAELATAAMLDAALGGALAVVAGAVTVAEADGGGRTSALGRAAAEVSAPLPLGTPCLLFLTL